MTVTVYEFNNLPNAQGEAVWPAAGANVTTVVAASTTHTTAANTKFVIVTTDADTRMAIGSGSTATVTALPILSAIANDFTFEGGNTVLKFL